MGVKVKISRIPYKSIQKISENRPRRRRKSAVLDSYSMIRKESLRNFVKFKMVNVESLLYVKISTLLPKRDRQQRSFNSSRDSYGGQGFVCFFQASRGATTTSHLPCFDFSCSRWVNPNNLVTIQQAQGVERKFQLLLTP